MEMRDLKFRISELLKDKFNGNKSEMARVINSSQPSITKWIEGISFPEYKAIYNLCVESKINPIWLILGVGKRELDTENSSGGISAYQIGSSNSNITQISHSNHILANENEALKTENLLLREMIEVYKKQSQK